MYRTVIYCLISIVLLSSHDFSSCPSSCCLSGNPTGVEALEGAVAVVFPPLVRPIQAHRLSNPPAQFTLQAVLHKPKHDFESLNSVEIPYA